MTYNLNIGSVVAIKNEIKKIMIIGKNDDGNYIGVLFPIGYINGDNNIVFNKDDIVEVYSIGYNERV